MLIEREHCCTSTNKTSFAYLFFFPINQLQHRSLDSYKPTGASPTDAQTGTSATYQFQYEGYTDYYAEDFSPYNYDYEDDGGLGGETKNVFCCLFAPWMGKQQQQVVVDGEKEGEGEDSVDENQQQQPERQQQEQQQEIASVGNQEGVSAAGAVVANIASPPKTDESTMINDESSSKSATTAPTAAASTQTAILSVAESVDERKSDSISIPTPKASINANLNKVAATIAISSGNNTSSAHGEEKKDEAVNESIKQDDGKSTSTAPTIKSILKVKRCTNHSTNSLNNHATNNAKKDLRKESDNAKSSSSPTKRHLFPTYEPKKSLGSDGNGGETRSINFNPMARVLTIPSRKDIPLSVKAQVRLISCVTSVDEALL